MRDSQGRQFACVIPQNATDAAEGANSLVNCPALLPGHCARVAGVCPQHMQRMQALAHGYTDSWRIRTCRMLSHNVFLQACRDRACS